MRILRVIGTSLTRQREYNIDQDWSVFLLAATLEGVAYLVALFVLAAGVRPWWPLLAFLVVYGVATLAIWRGQDFWQLENLITDDYAVFSYLKIATLGPVIVAALLSLVLAALALVLVVVLYAFGVSLVYAATAILLCLVGLLAFLALQYGWQYLLPMLLLPLIIEVIISRHRKHAIAYR